ncbi:flagellin, partial [Brevundimonas aveniformis]|uniref:flagellin n=1 Tax=Brevundimonas aveniformis TaxID=370977 RepID=UPI002490B1E9
DALMLELADVVTAATFDGADAFSIAWADPTATTAAAVQTVINTWAGELQTIGTNAKSYERQLAFTQKLQDALEAGAGNLVDADLAKESARLTALQTKQQLGVQALSIANSSSSALLGLFR